MSALCIIPARGGSKRIPRKNIKDFLGKPIIAYSIETALKSKIFDQVIVSTDDQEIAEIARQYGAEVPFLRSQKNSDDFATTADVIEETLNNKLIRIKNYEYCCCIYPTAPFINSQDLTLSHKLLSTEEFEAVVPIVEYTFPPARALTKLSNGLVSFIYPEHTTTRSQDLQRQYHDAGQFYWLKVSTFMKSPNLWPKKTGSIVLQNENVQDIDTPTDWLIAKIKYQLKLSDD